MRTAVLLALCALPAACMLPAGQAYGQVTAQFWVVTDMGNSYELDGPPPVRPPGFDAAPFLNVQRIDTVLAVHAGPAPGVDPVAYFGEAGVVTALPPHDVGRTEMSAMIMTDWNGPPHPQLLWASMPVGELRMSSHGPYLGPARVGDTPVYDLLAHCNAGAFMPFDVRCVHDRTGRNLTATNSTVYGHVLDLPASGRTIIHAAHTANATTPLEVMFTCPGCRGEAKAFYGGFALSPPFHDRGFGYHTDAYGRVPLAQLPPPYKFGAGSLAGLAWHGVTDANGITYWQEGGACTPSLSIGGADILGACPGVPVQGGTVGALEWQPLAPGWNLVVFAGHSTHSAIIISDPGAGARLQVRQGHTSCCLGFDGSVQNMARLPGGSGMAAVVHNTDRHLLAIPYGGEIPQSHPALGHMQDVRFAAGGEARLGSWRQLSHSDAGDPLYHGLFYDDGGAWPPYKVRLVEARSVQFGWPELDLLVETSISNFTREDLRRAFGAQTAGGLMDSEIFDVRNQVLLRQDGGRFMLWNGTGTDRAYIEPWLHAADSPVWEAFGVDLPKDALVMVDMYATIPVVKPTRLSDTYTSSIPCGDPGPGELAAAVEAVAAAAVSGRHDAGMVAFLLLADRDGPVGDNALLQQVYMASRTYLDYIDGEYAAGGRIHVPVLPGRPYLCTTIAPNILESEYILYALPFGESYMSLGGTEVFVDVPGPLGPSFVHAYEHRTGVQSPRNGIVSLDVTARFGAAVSALGLGYNTSAANATQWINGTLRAAADLSAGPTTVHLGSFLLDTYDMVEEAYAAEGPDCYGRFVTARDHSGYIAKTVSTPASQGEHIPVTLSVTVSNNNLTSSALCHGTRAESLVVQFLLETFAVDVR